MEDKADVSSVGGELRAEEVLGGARSVVMTVSVTVEVPAVVVTVVSVLAVKVLVEKVWVLVTRGGTTVLVDVMVEVLRTVVVTGRAVIGLDDG